MGTRTETTRPREGGRCVQQPLSRPRPAAAQRTVGEDRREPLPPPRLLPATGSRGGGAERASQGFPVEHLLRPERGLPLPGHLEEPVEGERIPRRPPESPTAALAVAQPARLR